MMIFLRRILALAIKEFLAILRDKKSRFILIGPPLAQLLIFGYAATFDLNHIPVAINNEDRGQAARALIARISASPHFDVVANIDRDAAIVPVIDNKQALVMVHIDTQFSDDLKSGRGAVAQIIIDGRNSNTALLAMGYLRTIFNDYNRDWLREHGATGPPAVLRIRPWYNENLLSRWFVVPGIVGLLSLVVTTIVTGLSVAREREAGTFDQLLVTPMRPAEILVGKAIPGVVIGLVEGSLILLLVVFWFEIPLRGSLGALYLGFFLFLLSAVGVGLMISSLARTQQQGILGAFLFLVPAVLLSGFATPIANMPEIVQQLTLINPMRYFMIILRGVFLEGDSYALLWQQYWPMAIIAFVTLIAAAVLFRWRSAA